MSNSPRLRLASSAQPPRVDALQDLPEVEPYESQVQRVLRGLAVLSRVRRADLLEAEALGARVYQIGAGELLIEAGERDRSILILAQGRAQVCHEEQVIAEVMAGELLGEAAYFSHTGARVASVRSATPCTLVVFGVDTLQRLRLSNNPVVDAVEHAALRMLAKRAQVTQRRLDERVDLGALGNLFTRLVAAYFPGQQVQRPELREVMRQCPALRHLSGRAWRAIAESSLLIELEAGQEIPADRAATVAVSGQLERVVSGGRVSARYAAGELVGLDGLLHPVRDGARLRATESSWVLCLSFARLQHRMKQDATLKHELQMLVAEQLVGRLAEEGQRQAA